MIPAWIAKEISGVRVNPRWAVAETTEMCAERCRKRPKTLDHACLLVHLAGDSELVTSAGNKTLEPGTITLIPPKVQLRQSVPRQQSHLQDSIVSVIIGFDFRPYDDHTTLELYNYLPQPAPIPNITETTIQAKMIADLLPYPRPRPSDPAYLLSRGRIETLVVDYLVSLSQNELLPSETNQHPEWLEQLQGILLDRFSDPSLTMSSISQQLGYARSTIHHTWQQYFSDSPMQRLRQIRLTRASDILLSNPEEKISTVARQCGYASVPLFNRHFKDHFEVSPRAYRRSKQ